MLREKLVPVTERELTALIKLSVEDNRFVNCVFTTHGAALRVGQGSGWALGHLMVWRFQDFDLFSKHSVY